MKGVSLETARLAFAAWLGAMLERHDRGRRLVRNPADDELVNRDAERFGVVWPYRIDREGPSWARWEPDRVSALDVLYEQVVDAAAGWSREDDFHVMLISFAPSTLPAKIVNRLIDRANPDTVGILGHVVHADAEQWRLAGLVEEAAQTLAFRRYCNPAYADHQLEEVLYAFRDHTYLPDWLGRFAPSSPEKATIAARFAVAGGEDACRHRKYHTATYAAALAAETARAKIDARRE